MATCNIKDYKIKATDPKDRVLERLDNFFSKYKGLTQQARMMSISSVLGAELKDLFFVGFYVVVEKQELQQLEEKQKKNLTIDDRYILEVGPYISTILATPLIEYGKGVCGQGWSEKKTQIVEDVTAIDNYIACDDDTQSEIVLPVFDKNDKEKVIAVLDVDSDIKGKFNEDDKIFFEKVLTYLNVE